MGQTQGNTEGGLLECPDCREQAELTSGFIFDSMELEAYTLAQSGSLVDLRIRNTKRYQADVFEFAIDYPIKPNDRL